jgi:hypothetical protein
MQIQHNGDGTVNVTLQPGDEIAPGLIYQDEEQTWQRVKVRNGQADVGDWSVKVEER